MLNNPALRLDQDAETRRDFLYLTAGTMAAVGTVAAVWPLIDSMNPAADMRALASAKADDTLEVPDPEPDGVRVQRDEWLVVVGVCTHLGCIPTGQGPASPRGKWDGWFCPCHGAHYDTSGRIRKGPAPRNLVVPQYAFLGDATVRIG